MKQKLTYVGGFIGLGTGIFISSILCQTGPTGTDHWQTTAWWLTIMIIIVPLIATGLGVITGKELMTCIKDVKEEWKRNISFRV